jgi:hypothetical protein
MAMPKGFTHFAPFPRNSSPSAIPRALISRLLKVLATLMPLGNPVTLCTIRRPAGPSWRQKDGSVTFVLLTGDVLPTQRPVKLGAPG